MPDRQQVILKREGWLAKPIVDPIIEHKVKRELKFYRQSYRETYIENMYGQRGFKIGLVDYLNEKFPHLEFVVDDIPPLPEIREDEAKEMGLYDYQLEAANLILRKGFGIISSVTGSGKTHIEMALIKRFPKPCLVLVPSRSLLLQMYRKCTEAGIKCSMYGDGVKDMSGDVVVMTNASFTGKKKKKKKGEEQDPDEKKKPPRSPEMKAFDKKIQSIIADEVHHCTAGLYAILGKCPAVYRAGFSATPWASDWQAVDVARLVANFGGVVFDSKGDERVEEKVHKPKVYIVDYNAKGITGQDVTDLLTAIRNKDFIGQKRLGLVQNRERNRLILKLAEICRLKGLHVFVVLAWVEHVEALKAIVRETKLAKNIHFLTGETKSSERDEVYNKIEGEESTILCGTVGAEGVDLKGLNAIIMADLGKSEIKVIQALGRAARKKEGKEYAFGIDIRDSLFSKHGKKRLKIYEQEEFEVNDQKALFEWLGSLETKD